MKLKLSLVLLFLCACAEPSTRLTNTLYTVSTSGCTASITYTNQFGGTNQKTSVSSPWRLEFQADFGQFLYISAQNDCDAGRVTVGIYELSRDELWLTIDDATSSGAFVIATASGTR